MFITPAFAQGAMPGGDLFFNLLPFVFIIVIIYLLIIRPQQKRQKDHRDMIDAVRRGDTVITAGGLIGKVTKVLDDGEVEVDLGGGTKVRVVKAMISDVRAKTEPVKSAGKK